MDVKLMAYKGKHVRPKEKKPWIRKLLFFVLIGLLIVGCLWGISSLRNRNPNETDMESNTTTPSLESFDNDSTTAPTKVVYEEPPETEPEPVIYTATIGAMGDLLMHKPLFGSDYKAEVYQSGTYNFESIFEHIKDDVSALDYAVANLETTLCGTDNGYEYSGYPSFNSPDTLIDSVKEAGFDMLLTANNHSMDTGLVGYKRTVNVVNEKGLETLGSYDDPEDIKWTIQNINNINVGMMCYTYATGETSDGRPILNGGYAMKEKDLCNYFSYQNLDRFYNEVETYLDEMNDAGADITMIYIHWGAEYQLKENAEQSRIAQRLCDMGIDVIIGGHPHVVQPVDLIESTISDHKTICVYSTGNAVSNQRQGALSAISTAHTEDGILCTVSFTKPENGEAYVSGFSIIPTWVNMFTNENGRREYNILPLHRETVDTWQEDYGLSNVAYNKAQESFDRTMDIVGNGLAEITEHLSAYEPEVPIDISNLSRDSGLLGKMNS